MPRTTRTPRIGNRTGQRPANGTGPRAEAPSSIGSIKLKTLGLCQLIVDSCPKNRRTESALGSIRAGAALAIEEIQASVQRGDM